LVPQISSHPTAQSAWLRRRPNTHENQFGIPNRAIDIRTEKQIPVANDFNHVPQSRFKDGQIGGIPRFDAGDIGIDDGDFDVGILQCDNGACRRSC
jgi:hypothetical protein